MPYKDKEVNRVYQRLWWRLHKEERLEDKRNQRQFYFENVRCTECGAPLIEEEFKWCVNCRINKNIPVIKEVLKYATSH